MVFFFFNNNILMIQLIISVSTVICCWNIHKNGCCGKGKATPPLPKKKKKVKILQRDFSYSLGSFFFFPYKLDDNVLSIKPIGKLVIIV
jgi:hypothetical protein